MKKTISSLAFVALLLVTVPAAHGQTSLYGTTFDNSAATPATYPYTDSFAYTSGADLVGQGNPGQVWSGNDDENGGTQEGTTGNYTGGLNLVQSSFEGSGLGAALFGGVSSGTPSGNVYPGKANVYVAQPLTLSTTAMTKGFVLDTDYSISTSTTAYTSSFGFQFLDASNANVVSVLFVTDPNDSNKDDLKYQIGASPVVNSGTSAITLGQTYHLTFSINVASNSFSISTGGLTPYLNISLGMTSPLTVTQVGAFQAVTDTTMDSFGGYIHDGNDQLGFDNFAVTEAPEPSTYVMTGLGLLGLLGLMKYRRVS